MQAAQREVHSGKRTRRRLLPGPAGPIFGAQILPARMTLHEGPRVAGRKWTRRSALRPLSSDDLRLSVTAVTRQRDPSHRSGRHVRGALHELQPGPISSSSKGGKYPHALQSTVSAVLSCWELPMLRSVNCGVAYPEQHRKWSSCTGGTIRATREWRRRQLSRLS